MKNVLITIANRYVGTNVEMRLMKDLKKIYMDTLDMKNPNLVNSDFL